MYNFALSAEEVSTLFTTGSLPAEHVDVMPANITDFSVYPVPAAEQIRVQFSTSNLAARANLSVYDIHGRLIERKDTGTANQVEFDVSGWPDGIYILQLDTGNASIVKKAVVRH